MSIFGKKNSELVEEANNFEERKITKNLKDLKPENKKKRKEPPKPWGPKERYVVLVVLIATTLISAILLFKSVVDRSGGMPKINMPKLDLNSINIFKGETITIERR